MGMQAMTVQQPLQQNGGFNVNNGFNPAQLYFQQNPDVAQSFAQNNYGMSQDQFAQTHYQKYGQAEGRNWSNSATSGQPQIGMPNQYSNTVGRWDNASIMPRTSSGKGGKTQGGYPTMQSNYSSGQSRGKGV